VTVYGLDPLLSDEGVARFDVIPTVYLEEEMDAVIVTVAHDQFRNIPLERIKESMTENPVIVDIRRLYDGIKAVHIGMHYVTM
jgi:UDP-N-acetyl-D-mannosaminuronate dehydrogenase